MQRKLSVNNWWYVGERRALAEHEHAIVKVVFEVEQTPGLKSRHFGVTARHKREEGAENVQTWLELPGPATQHARPLSPWWPTIQS